MSIALVSEETLSPCRLVLGICVTPLCLFVGHWWAERSRPLPLRPARQCLCLSFSTETRTARETHLLACCRSQPDGSLLVFRRERETQLKRLPPHEHRVLRQSADGRLHCGDGIGDRRDNRSSRYEDNQESLHFYLGNGAISTMLIHHAIIYESTVRRLFSDRIFRVF